MEVAVTSCGAGIVRNFHTVSQGNAEIKAYFEGIIVLLNFLNNFILQ